MAGWYHWPNGHEFEQALGVGDWHRGLLCYRSWGCKESDMTERLNWTEFSVLNLSILNQDPAHSKGARIWAGRTSQPSPEEWIKKLWYIYMMEYYSAIKRNEIMSFAATWMDLKMVILELCWWLSGKESICQWRRHGFNPLSRSIPSAAEQHMPVCQNYWACALEPGIHIYCFSYWSLWT